MNEKINILFACHKDPYGSRGRGGEISARIIAEYLQREGFGLIPWVRGKHTPANLRTFIEKCDVVLTWGQAAPLAVTEAINHGKPYVLMCRFWKNVAPLPAGDLMNRPVDRTFTKDRQEMFDRAAAVITNTKYSAKVIKRWYGRKAIVSYVPIAGEPHPMQYGKYLTIITPEIYGEATLISALAPQMPDHEFLIVNTWKEEVARFDSMGENVQVWDYRADMSEVWEKTRILLLPIYENDICGTRRITIEGFRHAVPVIANRRCGVWEKIPDRMLIDRNAASEAWIRKIEEIEQKYQVFQKLAVKAFEQYDTPAQLAIFKREILKAVKKEKV